MRRLLLSVTSMLAACAPAPQKVAMPSPDPVPPTSAQGSRGQAASSAPADSPAEAAGRRILSTAFVRVGPDARLTVELSDGRSVVLRDVVMRARDYCGVHAGGDATGAKYCGGYAEVAAARPGGAAAADPVEPARGPAKPK